jgi:hypothetical protein
MWQLLAKTRAAESPKNNDAKSRSCIEDAQCMWQLLAETRAEELPKKNNDAKSKYVV